MKARNELKNEQLLFEDNAGDASNVLDFTSTLKELRKNVDPNLVRHREAWRDKNGNVRLVEYVEWHTVADILDETAPNWVHAVKDIRAIGDFMIVTVAITIDGVTREGIGTGSARSEMGIKKAEHDALKRAAVKFGIARDLYRREFDAFERQDAPEPKEHQFPADPIAKTLAEMITTKQLGMIRAMAREQNIDVDKECRSLMNCGVSELSRRAASAFIDHLQDQVVPEMPIRRAS